MASSTATSNVITLKGSTDIVTEFFHYSINNILYQRGIYPPETFRKVSKYNLSIMISSDENLLSYLTNIQKQLEIWLTNGAVQKLVLVIKGSESGETLERWVFDCECKVNAKGTEEIKSEKSEKEIVQEIQAIMRQITASVTFLPLLDEPCFFDLLIYADKEATVPVQWEDSDPCYIKNAEQVKMRSFDTKIHKVDLAVSYRLDPDSL